MMSPAAGGPAPLPLSEAVRHELVARQLRGHLPPPPGRAVDLGAGTGEWGIRLAREGFDVTLLDRSPSRIRRMRGRLEQEDAGVTARIVLVEAAAGDAPRRLAAGAFDVVCSHAVLPFTDDPGGLMETMAALAAPGATLSVVWKNADALAMRAGLAGRFEEALELLRGADERAGTGRMLAAHALDEVSAAAAAAGVTAEAWYGVQVFTAHRNEHADDARLADAVRLEEEAGRRDPYRRMARQLHLVGRVP